MAISLNISTYIARSFLKNFIVIFGSFSLITILADFLELTRIASKKENVELLTLVRLSFLKFPEVGQKIVPFCITIATLLTFIRFSRTSELVVFKSVGISVWKFSIPVLFTVWVMGILLMIFINPISAMMLKKYDNLKNKYFKDNSSQITISRDGFWLRQVNYNDAGGEIIIRANALNDQKKVKDRIELYDVTILILGSDNVFQKRIDAAEMIHFDGDWQLRNVLITNADSKIEHFPEFFLETNLSIKDIYNSFTAPTNIGFWDLPGFISAVEKSGFSATSHRLEFYNLLLTPLFYVGMSLVGLLFSLSPVRSNKQGMLIGFCVITGFTIYFLINIIFSLGLSKSIPIIIASTAPVMLILLITTTILLHIEDG